MARWFGQSEITFISTLPRRRFEGPSPPPRFRFGPQAIGAGPLGPSRAVTPKVKFSE